MTISITIVKRQPYIDWLYMMLFLIHLFAVAYIFLKIIFFLSKIFLNNLVVF
jgi:hypothetical protein